MSYKVLLAFFVTFLCYMVGFSHAEAAVQLQAIDLSTTTTATQIDFSFNAKPTVTLGYQASASRLTVTVKHARLVTGLPDVSNTTLVQKLTALALKNGQLRITIELQQAVTYQWKLKKLSGSKIYRYRLILSPKKKPSIERQAGKQSAAPIVGPPVAMTSVKANAVKPTLTAQANSMQSPYLVVVIDPGHGGKDSGARGPHGYMEKDVVLSISRYLRADLQAVPGIKVYMTRDSDVFIPLRGRLDIARQYKADIFIAMHADAFKNKEAHGASVFALSERGATSESARWLAEKENQSEMLGGADLSNKNYLLRSVLIDMSQTATINASLDLGTDVLNQFRKFTALHMKRVGQAAFVVLKSPDIPSILIENGFISNPQEEKNLTNSRYQQKLADAIKTGVVNYFKEHAAPNTIFRKNQK